MDSLSLRSFVHRNMSSMDNTYTAPDLSPGLDDTSSVSLSPNTPLLSPHELSHGSGGFSRTLGGSLSYGSGAYSSNLQDKYQQLERQLLNEKEEHMKLRKVSRLLIFQPNS
jgi:hypothetical protein